VDPKTWSRQGLAGNVSRRKFSERAMAQDVGDTDEQLTRVYTVNEIAGQMKCTRQFVATEIRRGRLHAHRFGDRQYRITAEQFRAWLDGMAAP